MAARSGTLDVMHSLVFFVLKDEHIHPPLEIAINRGVLAETGEVSAFIKVFWPTLKRVSVVVYPLHHP